MSRYAAVHESGVLAGPGDARPTALDIIRDEARENDFVGKAVVITGCSSGLGPATAEALAATGATLYCTARDLDKMRTALGPALLGTGRVHLLYMDHTDLATVKAAADTLHRRESAVSILVNNAGVMTVPARRETKDGFELQIGTNHFAHFYLFCLLRDLLEAGSTPAFASRVVNVSSVGHRWGPLHLDDLQLARPGAYTPDVGYANSKVANIYMANMLDRKYGGGRGGGKAIHGYSLMPGGIRTPLMRYMEPGVAAQLELPDVARFLKSPAQGAATTVFAAVARELEGRGGVYLDNCAVAGEFTPGDGPQTFREPGYAPWAMDPAKEAALWTASLKAVGLPEDF